MKLPIVLGQPQGRGADGKQHDGPDYGSDPAEAITGPAAVNATDGHASQGETAQATRLDIAEAELSLEAVKAVGQHH